MARGTFNSRNKRIQLRKIRFYLFALIPLILAIIFLKGDSGLINQYRLMRKKDGLQREIRELEAKCAQLEDAIRLLQTDSAYIERIAREEYGLGKADEMIFIIDEEKIF